MRLLADENVHAIVIERLRSAGYDVVSIAEESPGTSDRSVLERQDIETTVLLTYDRDFGELVFNQGLPPPCGIIYSRLGRADPGIVAERVRVLLAGGVVAGRMTVIEVDGNRTRDFPGSRLEI